MAFDYEAAYVLTSDDVLPQIVLGCYLTPLEGRKNPVVRLLIAGGNQAARTLSSTSVTGDSKHIEVENADENLHWAFDRLTLPLWNELGNNGFLIGYDDLKNTFKTDEELQSFYVQNFLLTVPWYQKLDAPKQPSSEE